MTFWNRTKLEQIGLHPYPQVRFVIMNKNSAKMVDSAAEKIEKKAIMAHNLWTIMWDIK